MPPRKSISSRRTAVLCLTASWRRASIVKWRNDTKPRRAFPKGSPRLRQNKFSRRECGPGVNSDKTKMKSAQTKSSELANGGKAAAGARALARFNAHLRAMQEMSALPALRTLKRRERRASSRSSVAPASWSAAVLCRFPSAAKKAPEGWRSPKPRGVVDAGMNFPIAGSSRILITFGMANEEQLKSIATKTIWSQTPEVSLRNLPHLRGAVMTLSNWDEVKTVSASFGWEAFRRR